MSEYYRVQKLCGGESLVMVVVGCWSVGAQVSSLEVENTIVNKMLGPTQMD